MMIADAHLDLAYNALRGRDLLRAAAEQATDAEGVPTVGFPDLRKGGGDLVCATVFAMPSLGDKPGYRSTNEAAAVGAAQRAWYREHELAGHFRFVRSAAELPAHSREIEAPLAAILLLEGADPLRTPNDLP